MLQAKIKITSPYIVAFINTENTHTHEQRVRVKDDTLLLLLYW